MKRLMAGTAFVALILSTEAHAQSAASNAPADAGHAPAASCVILKRIGRIGRTESRLSHFGISGKQFRYVEGKLPDGLFPRQKMNDHDVRNLQARGAQVLVLDSHYTSDDLKEARANCEEATVKTPTQTEAKASPAPTPAANASTPSTATKPLTPQAPVPKTDDSPSSKARTGLAASAPLPTPNTAKAPAPKSNYSGFSMGATEAALVDVSSTPAGADVYIDERFFGHTPAATIILMPGDHKFAVKKDGFVIWKKKLNLPAGRINVDAELLPKRK